MISVNLRFDKFMGLRQKISTFMNFTQYEENIVKERMEQFDGRKCFNHGTLLFQ